MFNYKLLQFILQYFNMSKFESQQNYYIIDGNKYHKIFPHEWATSHASIIVNGTLICSGPRDCQNCRLFGSIKGVFVSYCANCANYVYSKSRGDVIMDMNSATDVEIEEHLKFLENISSGVICGLRKRKINQI